MAPQTAGSCTEGSPAAPSRSRSFLAKIQTSLTSIRGILSPKKTILPQKEAADRSNTTARISPAGAGAHEPRACSQIVPETQQAPESEVIAMSHDLPPGMAREVWRVQDFEDVEPVQKESASEIYRARCRCVASL